jgi:hypothetical protein
MQTFPYVMTWSLVVNRWQFHATIYAQLNYSLCAVFVYSASGRQLGYYLVSAV